MASTTITPDRYSIGINNYSQDPGPNGYLKNNSAHKLGGYARGAAAGYVWDILFYPSSWSPITTSDTINSVSISVTFAAESLSGNTFELKVHPEDMATWTDNGSTSPTWDEFDTTTGTKTWGTAVASTTGVGGTGTKTIASTANLVSLVQSYTNGTYPSGNNKGFVLTFSTGFFGWYVTVSNVQMTIDYTTSGGATRRRIIIM